MAAAVWKGDLSFGLVSIPVKLFRAARSERIPFRQLYRAPTRSPQAAASPLPEPRAEPHAEQPVTRIEQRLVAPEEEQPVSRSDLVKGYEYEKDRYVVVDREELKSLAPKTSRVMQILEFVRITDIDPVYLETSYYLAADRGGEKPYALLFEALQRTGLAGLAQVAMHNRGHIVIVRPGGAGILAHTMFYEDEIRRDLELPADTSLINPRELELAVLFVKSLAAKFEPRKYRDEYREKVQALIEAKIQGRQGVEAPPPPPARAPVLDIVEALQKSLALSRKPPAAAAPEAPRRARKTAR